MTWYGNLTNYLQSYDESVQMGQAPYYGHTVKKKHKIFSFEWKLYEIV